MFDADTAGFMTPPSNELDPRFKNRIAYIPVDGAIRIYAPSTTILNNTDVILTAVVGSPPPVSTAISPFQSIQLPIADVAELTFTVSAGNAALPFCASS